MSVNNNRPVQPTPAQKPINPMESLKKMGNVVKTLGEAATDKVYDADGDNTQLSDVKAAVNELSTTEKVAMAAGGWAAGAAVEAVSFIGEKAGEAAEAVKEKYSNPPEKKAFGKLVNTMNEAIDNVTDNVEEFVDDLKDGRIARDIEKNVKRFHRDHFTERSGLQKAADKIGDAAQDAAHAAADLADDIADGRILK